MAYQLLLWLHLRYLDQLSLMKRHLVTDSPPSISISFTAALISVLNNSNMVNFTITSHDDFSGIYGCNVDIFPSSSSVPSLPFYFPNYAPSLWLEPSTLWFNASGTITIPRYSPSGNWTYQATCSDNSFKTSILIQGTAFIVVSQYFYPPQILNIEAIPQTVDTSLNSVIVTYNISFNASLAGITRCTFEPPTSTSMSLPITFTNMNPTLYGSLEFGALAYTASFPQYTTIGNYTLQSITCIDNADFQTTLNMTTIESLFPGSVVNQIGASGSGGPIIRDLQVSPSIVNTTLASATVTISLMAVDETGINSCSCEVVSPTSGPSMQQLTMNPAFTGAKIFLAYFLLPQYSVNGTYIISSVQCMDNAYRSTSLQTNVHLVQEGHGDILEPTLLNFQIFPITVNTSTSSAAISAQFTASDDYSGVVSCTVTLAVVSPTSVSDHFISLTTGSPPLISSSYFQSLRYISLTATASLPFRNAATISVISSIPRFYATTALNITGIQCSDAAQNVYSTDVYNHIQIMQVGLGDELPPTASYKSLTFQSRPFETLYSEPFIFSHSFGSIASIPISLNASDDFSGVLLCSVTLYNSVSYSKVSGYVWPFPGSLGKFSGSIMFDSSTALYQSQSNWSSSFFLPPITCYDRMGRSGTFGPNVDGLSFPNTPAAKFVLNTLPGSTVVNPPSVVFAGFSSVQWNATENATYLLFTFQVTSDAPSITCTLELYPSVTNNPLKRIVLARSDNNQGGSFNFSTYVYFPRFFSQGQLSPNAGVCMDAYGQSSSQFFFMQMFTNQVGQGDVLPPILNNLNLVINAEGSFVQSIFLDVSDDFSGIQACFVHFTTLTDLQEQWQLQKQHVITNVTFAAFGNIFETSLVANASIINLPLAQHTFLKVGYISSLTCYDFAGNQLYLSGYDLNTVLFQQQQQRQQNQQQLYYQQQNQAQPLILQKLQVQLGFIPFLLVNLESTPYTETFSVALSTTNVVCYGQSTFVDVAIFIDANSTINACNLSWVSPDGLAYLSLTMFTQYFGQNVSYRGTNSSSTTSLPFSGHASLSQGVVWRGSLPIPWLTPSGMWTPLASCIDSFGNPGVPSSPLPNLTISCKPTSAGLRPLAVSVTDVIKLPVDGSSRAISGGYEATICWNYVPDPSEADSCTATFAPPSGSSQRPVTLTIQRPLSLSTSGQICGSLWFSPWASWGSWILADATCINYFGGASMFDSSSSVGQAVIQIPFGLSDELPPTIFNVMLSRSTLTVNPYRPSPLHLIWNFADDASGVAYCNASLVSSRAWVQSLFVNTQALYNDAFLSGDSLSGTMGSAVSLEFNGLPQSLSVNEGIITCTDNYGHVGTFSLTLQSTLTTGAVFIYNSIHLHSPRLLSFFMASSGAVPLPDAFGPSHDLFGNTPASSRPTVVLMPGGPPLTVKLIMDTNGLQYSNCILSLVNSFSSFFDNMTIIMEQTGQRGSIAEFWGSFSLDRCAQGPSFSIASLQCQVDKSLYFSSFTTEEVISAGGPVSIVNECISAWPWTADIPVKVTLSSSVVQVVLSSNWRDSRSWSILDQPKIGNFSNALVVQVDLEEFIPEGLVSDCTLQFSSASAKASSVFTIVSSSPLPLNSVTSSSLSYSSSPSLLLVNVYPVPYAPRRFQGQLLIPSNVQSGVWILNDMNCSMPTAQGSGPLSATSGSFSLPPSTASVRVLPYRYFGIQFTVNPFYATGSSLIQVFSPALIANQSSSPSFQPLASTSTISLQGKISGVYISQSSIDTSQSSSTVEVIVNTSSFLSCTVVYASPIYPEFLLGSSTSCAGFNSSSIVVPVLFPAGSAQGIWRFRNLTCFGAGGVPVTWSTSFFRNGALDIMQTGLAGSPPTVFQAFFSGSSLNVSEASGLALLQIVGDANIVQCTAQLLSPQWSSPLTTYTATSTSPKGYASCVAQPAATENNINTTTLLCTFNLPQYSPLGTYTLSQLSCSNNFGTRLYSIGAIKRLGDVNLFISSFGDTVPPIITAVSGLSITVDSSQNIATALVIVNASDAGDVGVSSASGMRSCSAAFALNASTAFAPHPIWATAYSLPEPSGSGTFSSTLSLNVTFPMGSPQGLWQLVGLECVDRAGNVQILSSFLIQALTQGEGITQAGPGDLIPPTIMNANVSDSVLYPGSSSSLVLQVNVTDDWGVVNCSATLIYSSPWGCALTADGFTFQDVSGAFSKWVVPLTHTGESTSSPPNVSAIFSAILNPTSNTLVGDWILDTISCTDIAGRLSTVSGSALPGLNNVSSGRAFFSVASTTLPKSTVTTTVSATVVPFTTSTPIISTTPKNQGTGHTSSSSSSFLLVIAAAAGGGGALVIIIVIVLVVRRRRRSRVKNNSLVPLVSYADDLVALQYVQDGNEQLNTLRRMNRGKKTLHDDHATYESADNPSAFHAGSGQGPGVNRSPYAEPGPGFYSITAVDSSGSRNMGISAAEVGYERPFTVDEPYSDLKSENLISHLAGTDPQGYEKPVPLMPGGRYINVPKEKDGPYNETSLDSSDARRTYEAQHLHSEQVPKSSNAPRLVLRGDISPLDAAAAIGNHPTSISTSQDGPSYEMPTFLEDRYAYAQSTMVRESDTDIDAYETPVFRKSDAQGYEIPLRHNPAYVSTQRQSLDGSGENVYESGEGQPDPYANLRMATEKSDLSQYEYAAKPFSDRDEGGGSSL